MVQWDKQRVDSILSEDDETLRERIGIVAQLLELEDKTYEKLVSDLASLRQKAKDFTEKDFLYVKQLLGEEALQELVAALEGKQNG